LRTSSIAADDHRVIGGVATKWHCNHGITPSAAFHQRRQPRHAIVPTWLPTIIGITARSVSSNRVLSRSQQRAGIGVIEALWHANMSVPDDVAVVCFDDIELASVLIRFYCRYCSPCRSFGTAHSFAGTAQRAKAIRSP